MVFELQRIRTVCGCGPLVSLPYWLCQPACYHTHTHRGGIARKAKKNERTYAQHFQTTSRGNDREPHSSTLEMEISQLARLGARATTGTDEAPFLLARRGKTHSHTHTPPVSAPWWWWCRKPLRAPQQRRRRAKATRNKAESSRVRTHNSRERGK